MFVFKKWRQNEMFIRYNKKNTNKNKKQKKQKKKKKNNLHLI